MQNQLNQPHKLPLKQLKLQLLNNNGSRLMLYNGLMIKKLLLIKFSWKIVLISVKQLLTVLKKNSLLQSVKR